MSGHVVYEMASGKELTSLSPNEQDYKAVNSKDVKEFLRWVFQQDDSGRFIQSIEQVAIIIFSTFKMLLCECYYY